MENKLVIGGTVVGTDGNMLMIDTMDVGTNGREFVENLVVVCKKKDLKDLKAGDRIKVVGCLGRNDENRTIIIGNTIEPYSDSRDLNMARLVGTAYRSFEFYPRIEGSGAFGNLLVTVDNTIYRGTAFGHTAHMLNRDCTEGSEIKLQGRIRIRPYSDREGDMQNMTEIVADPKFTKVLKTAVIVDPLDELDKQTAAGI